MELYGHQLFRRCVQCPAEVPSCPPCASDETCTLIASSCTACASTVCTKTSGGESHKHSTPAGAIAGGVIGGVAVIAIITYLVWRYFIRERRKEWDAQTWTDVDVGLEKTDQTGSHRSARQSTRSVHSIASTVLTRASNVIQIAYIPGVTNRSPPDTPGVLVPPVPPLPLTTVHSVTASPNFEQDQHFFLPSDIRDSTWSGYSDVARASISPSLARSSVATTIYRNNAIVSPMPAQQAYRGKAAVVSVKSGSTTPTIAESQRTPTPPMPANAAAIANSGSSIVARQMIAKPIEVKKSSSSTKVPTLGNLQKAKAAQNKNVQAKSDSSEDGSSDEGPRLGRARKSLSNNNRDSRRAEPAAVIDDAPVDAFSSSTARDSSTGANHRHKKSGSLQSLIEEAVNRAAKEPRHGGLQSISETHKKDGGPFSDANELKENF